MMALKYPEYLKIQLQLRNERISILRDVYSNIYFIACFLAIQFNRNDFYQRHRLNDIHCSFA
jgi:hypothetical protein